VWQDKIDAAGFAVWARIQAGESLTMQLCRQVIAELGSTARPERVHYLVRQWQADTARTRRLSRR
jgi:hypothetical protein